MNCVVVSSLLGIVDQLYKNPCLILPEIDDAQIIISTLKDKLHSLQAYLDKPRPIIASVPDRDKAVKRLDEEIRDVAMKAEDEIESKVGEVYLAAKQQQGEAAACEDLHRSLQKVVKDFESVEVRIRDLQTRHTASIHDVSSSSSSSSTPPCLQLENHEFENTMIGMEGDVEKIKGMLIQTSSSTQLQVVSIQGLIGTGKTTLAKKVYEDPSIVSHFDIQAWTVEGQVNSLRDMHIDILSCIVSLTKEEISKQNDKQLVEQLRKLLMGQRYLIVIDDLFSITAWNDNYMSWEIWSGFMSTSFPDDRNGSRVLITTRKMKVAEFASSSDMWIFYTDGLNPEESWKLLSKNATSNGKCSSLPPEFEIIGRSIAEKCMGMPLVIVLIGGLLSTLNNSPRQWEDILFTISSCNFPLKLLHYTFEVCYDYLPTHLKACFLYFGVFRKKIEIHVKKLIELWVAGGFVKPEMNKSLEEIAKDYLCDLINRRLVQIHKRSLGRKIKSCMLHDMLHEFCFRKAIKEDIKRPRWVSPTSYFTDPSPETRSFFYFAKNLYLAKCWSIFSSLKLLRILDLSSVKYWHGMPSEIVNLVHLRYFALRTIGSVCNSQLFKLQNLQTLILSAWTKEYQLQLPCDVLDLPWLRHVRFDKGSSSYLPNLVQENLQTLSWFKVTGRDTRTSNFTKVPNLKELGIYIEGELLPNALDSLARLHQLEKLKVKTGRVERFNLPNCFPSKLKQLTLCNTYLSWEDMDIIGNLPSLDLLKLKDFACCGPEWTPRDGEFLQLRFFLIERSDLKHWNANANHFPALEHLILRYCWDMEKLPSDFEEVCTLRLIELDNCCFSLVTSAKEIQQAQRDLGYEGLVVRDVTKIELPTNESSEKRSEYTIW
ncbi:PREDICTED: putative late blight resistance protein homolog R1A-10 isoform X2 [Ipomoea nil]|uniref:putative late blight resistance protein homolog R1A-10 isoform X2 n=1 Tax=Ipomoea nil TaxID=35883 RepID=UPI0009018178|nr:PREDICTED: putative late blight resistance protein homolog R1A-10 isoform X2 [Ipomoea nil]XP_019175718.1 PREDICTED: putative late blight resistance protein homolog R1A-10 isoform X2 [Ipomoea nil]